LGEEHENSHHLLPGRAGDVGLNLEYIPYIVSVQLVVQRGETTESKDAELLLAQDYHQRWSLRFWDALMGI